MLGSAQSFRRNSWEPSKPSGRSQRRGCANGTKPYEFQVLLGSEHFGPVTGPSVDWTQSHPSRSTPRWIEAAP